MEYLVLSSNSKDISIRNKTHFFSNDSPMNGGHCNKYLVEQKLFIFVLNLWTKIWNVCDWVCTTRREEEEEEEEEVVMRDWLMTRES